MKTICSRSLFPALTLMASVAAVTGCISEEEREARRRFAFDLAGAYTEERAADAGALTIENQGDKNDVKITFDRGAAYDGEQAFIDRLANDGDKAAVLDALALGDGNDGLEESVGDGGENISTNFGASSELYVVTNRLAALPGVDGAVESTLRYALRLEIENGTDRLAGHLEVIFEEKRPEVNDAGETIQQTHIEQEDLPVVFLRDAGVIEADRCDDCTEDAEDEPAEEEVEG